MSSHHCAIRASLKLKPGVSLTEIKIACEPLEDLVGKSFDKMDIHFAEGELVLDYIDCWTDGVGYHNQNLDELADNLASLVSEPDWIELLDDDTGADDKIDVYFVAGSGEALMQIQLKYGVERAREFIEPLVGRDTFNSMADRLYQQFLTEAGYPSPEVQEADKPAETTAHPCKWFAVTGRQPGKDEDHTQVFQLASSDEAIQAFTEAIYVADEDPKTQANVIETYGAGVFITSVTVSDSEISVM
ncbi:hypothetical protein [Uliginosibacterium gangwonense]|uniref:hypothetical protein n=1 Tax=Uliginosibacterium gangwonense TaxID=392736 RepID=UPI000380F981|nr:hypothetical protein [Uliginosibacterium gangwonense]